jgi:UDP-N-acetylglucosamine--N-acetylmuramyl-(pentapeptide) pyrophosphoryl-undecaprenol N-acetylglucosamine transferase
LSRAAAGWCVAQAELSPDSLAKMLMRIFSDPLSLAACAAAAHSLATPHAAEKLADVVDDLVRRAA